MLPIVTHRVAWSVGLSVCHNPEPCKKAKPVEILCGPMEPCVRWGQGPPWEGTILEEGAAHRKM